MSLKYYNIDNRVSINYGYINENIAKIQNELHIIHTYESKSHISFCTFLDISMKVVLKVNWILCDNLTQKLLLYCIFTNSFHKYLIYRYVREILMKDINSEII